MNFTYEQAKKQIEHYLPLIVGGVVSSLFILVHYAGSIFDIYLITMYALGILFFGTWCIKNWEKKDGTRS